MRIAQQTGGFDESVCVTTTVQNRDGRLHGPTVRGRLPSETTKVALRRPGPVAMLTSDVDDMARLCGDRVRLIGI